MNLNECNWVSFKISDIFIISTGSLVNKAKIKIGNNPRITAKATDNGIDSFTEIADGFRTNHNCVSISFLGNCFYQPYVASYDMKIHSITIKGKELNRFIGLFLANQFNQEFKKFSYGNQLSSKDLAKQHVLLPATANGQPDWQFMEDYMRQKEQQILKPTIDKLCKQLINNEIGGGYNLLSIKWKEYCIGDLFIAKRPTSRREDDYAEGNISFVASGGVNNGVTKFCTPKSEEKLDKGNCLTISPVDGSCYYQPTDFLGRGGAGSSIILLYPKTFEMNRFNGLFISKAVSNTAASKYSYGHMASIDRIRKDKILLPSDNKGNPDFSFMSSFMQEVEHDILATTLKYFHNKHNTNTITPPRNN